jgi:hypothetical protein
LTQFFFLCYKFYFLICVIKDLHSRRIWISGDATYIVCKYFAWREQVRLPIVQFVDDARAFINGGHLYSVWWEKRSLKFKFELWQHMQVKRTNRLISIIDEIWVVHLQKVNTLSMIGIYFSMSSRSFIENSAPDLYLLRIAYHHLSKWRYSGRKWEWSI